MNSFHIEPKGVRHPYRIPLVEVSEYLVGQPTPRLEVSFTNNGSTKK
jgi:hypothetical protein